MKRVLLKDTKKIKAGSISGSFLSGIGSIINSISNLFSTIIGSISTSVYMFLDRDKNHVKADYKIGNNEVSFDDSKEIDLEKAKLDHEQKDQHHNETIDLNKIGHEKVSENFDYSTDHLNQEFDHNYYDLI